MKNIGLILRYGGEKSNDQTEEVRVKRVLFVILLISFSASGQDAITDAPLAFHPVEPCRVVDTRVESVIACATEDLDGECTHWIYGLAGFLVAGDETREAYKDRGFASVFPFTFADQGGKPGGCWPNCLNTTSSGRRLPKPIRHQRNCLNLISGLPDVFR